MSEIARTAPPKRRQIDGNARPQARHRPRAAGGPVRGLHLRGLDQSEPGRLQPDGEPGGEAVGGDVPARRHIGIERERDREPQRGVPGGIGLSDAEPFGTGQPSRGSMSARRRRTVPHGEDRHAVRGLVGEAEEEAEAAPHRVGGALAPPPGTMISGASSRPGRGRRAAR